MANFFPSFSMIFYYRKLYHTIWVTILVPPLFVMITLTFLNRSYHGNRSYQINDLIFHYLTIGIIYNMSLFVYNANILLYILGGHSNIYNNWVFTLIVHSKIETFQFSHNRDRIVAMIVFFFLQILFILESAFAKPYRLLLYAFLAPPPKPHNLGD